MVLLHGLGRSPASMSLCAWRLTRAGFEVRKIGYPSTRQTMAEALAHVRQALGKMPETRFSLVGHSLGGLIAAQLLHDPQGLQIDRAVQLGAPNRGSPMVGRLGWLWPVRRICGPALDELAYLVPPSHASPRIASIGGTASWPMVSHGFERPNDGVVTLRSAWSGAGHRGRVHNLHSFLPISPRAISLTIAFLRDGTMEPT